MSGWLPVKLRLMYHGTEAAARAGRGVSLCGRLWMLCLFFFNLSKPFYVDINIKYH
jgi:hypothetical protein